jgi:hypothetical protein
MPEAVAVTAPQSDFDLGRTALLEITTADAIGSPAGSLDQGDGVTTVYFETNLSGYPGWRWTVSIAHVDGQPASALETELTPGDGALLSPAWVPWVDRLAEYTASQEPDDEDESDDDDDDDDDLGSDVLHSGDVDGVDIDDDDEPAEDDDDELDDESEDDSEDDSDEDDEPDGR